MSRELLMDDVQKMQVAMAELRADIRHLSHDVKNLTMKLDALPTPRDLISLGDRVKNVEGNLHKAAWAIIGAWISGLGVVAAIVLKLGH